MITAAFLALVFGLDRPVILEGSASPAAGEATPQVKDFDALYFESEKAYLLRKGLEPDLRSSHIPRLVELNAREAIPVLVSLLDDPREDVRRTAAEYLATLGDQRGLDIQLTCVTSPACERSRLVALRLLGNSDRQEFAAPIAERVREAYQRSLKDGKFLPTTSDRAYIRSGLIALARMGRKEDRDLALKVIGTGTDQTLDRDFLETLGYLGDPRANQVLWSAYEILLEPPKSIYGAVSGAVKRSPCAEGGMGVSALLPLSRLGDSLAIEKLSQIIRGGGTPTDPTGSERTRPTLCGARGLAIESLKPRDAKNFAEVVFEVAAQEPEGAGTREAWIALG